MENIFDQKWNILGEKKKRIQLKTMFVVDHDSLYTLQTFDKDIIHKAEEIIYLKVNKEQT